MELGLNGRVALVMGGSAGIGQGIAEALAREGATVAVASRSSGYRCDTADLEAVAALPARVVADLGPIDILVTNTGGPPAGSALGPDLDAWRTAYDSLVLAPRVLTEAVVPGMSERGWGRIINVGSTSTNEPIPGLTLSNAHRMAAVGFFKTLATEVADKGITVNTVATGHFATERLASLFGSMEAAEANAATNIPVGRLGRPEEYGDLVAFLASDRAAFLTGTVIPLDGGAGRSV